MESYTKALNEAENQTNQVQRSCLVLQKYMYIVHFTHTLHVHVHVHVWSH